MGYTYQLSFHRINLQNYFLDFTQAPADFVGTFKIGFFCEAATETTNRKLGTTPHINNRPHGVYISALFSSPKPSELFSGF
jgi:hypothetical protein